MIRQMFDLSKSLFKLFQDFRQKDSNLIETPTRKILDNNLSTYDSAQQSEVR